MTESATAQHDPFVSASYSIVLFDGVCRFCNGWVQFLIERDRSDRFRFAPLQSDYAQALLSSAQAADPSVMDSVILIEGTAVYTHSTAVLHIFKRLGGSWSFLYVFSLIPRSIRDKLYRLIAEKRYRLFGKYDSCMMPTEQVRRKFLG